MPMIEGIGDEVIQFCGLFFAAVLGVIAWWSTGIREIPRITVFVLGSREQAAPERSPEERSSTGEHSAGGEKPKENGSDSRLLPESEQTTAEDNQTNPERDAAQQNEENGQTLSEEASAANETPNPENIRIRLKYLNDEQKLVEGKLQELLGDFKRRNFRSELSRQQRIRLIFNGGLLQSDDQTLQGCGLFDNCVVHCLVHPQANVNASNPQSHAHNAPPEWNLGGLLYALLSIMFGIAWFCRYQYSHLFNIITTGTLVGLTIMFAGSVIGLYTPDHEVVPQ